MENNYFVNVNGFFPRDIWEFSRNHPDNEIVKRTCNGIIQVREQLIPIFVNNGDKDGHKDEGL